mmetsp:Transcript_11276/g.29794  ORF Transcript_11276/g.29794 Transcript_11276/m.29794 type:complete len:227 (-) Transcript_11276:5177-5857(-)
MKSFGGTSLTRPSVHFCTSATASLAFAIPPSTTAVFALCCSLLSSAAFIISSACLEASRRDVHSSLIDASLAFSSARLFSFSTSTIFFAFAVDVMESTSFTAASSCFFSWLSLFDASSTSCSGVSGFGCDCATPPPSLFFPSAPPPSSPPFTSISVTVFPCLIAVASIAQWLLLLFIVLMKVMRGMWRLIYFTSSMKSDRKGRRTWHCDSGTSKSSAGMKSGVKRE